MFTQKRPLTVNTERKKIDLQKADRIVEVKCSLIIPMQLDLP